MTRFAKGPAPNTGREGARPGTESDLGTTLKGKGMGDTTQRGGAEGGLMLYIPGDHEMEMRRVLRSVWKHERSAPV